MGKIKVMAKVIKVQGKGNFLVETDEGHKIQAYPSGNMRRFFIKIMEGDIVDVELSEYDLYRGRITYRH